MQDHQEPGVSFTKLNSSDFFKVLFIPRRNVNGYEAKENGDIKYHDWVGEHL